MAIVFIWPCCVIATGILASNKGRAVGDWVLLAILLGPIALLFAAVVSNKKVERHCC